MIAKQPVRYVLAAATLALLPAAAAAEMRSDEAKFSTLSAARADPDDAVFVTRADLEDAVDTILSAILGDCIDDRGKDLPLDAVLCPWAKGLVPLAAHGSDEWGKDLSPDNWGATEQDLALQGIPPDNMGARRLCKVSCQWQITGIFESQNDVGKATGQFLPPFAFSPTHAAVCVPDEPTDCGPPFSGAAAALPLVLQGARTLGGVIVTNEAYQKGKEALNKMGEKLGDKIYAAFPPEPPPPIYEPPAPAD